MLSVKEIFEQTFAIGNFGALAENSLCNMLLKLKIANVIYDNILCKMHNEPACFTSAGVNSRIDVHPIVIMSVALSEKELNSAEFAKIAAEKLHEIGLYMIISTHAEEHLDSFCEAERFISEFVNDMCMSLSFDTLVKDIKSNRQYEFPTLVCLSTKEFSNN